MKITVSELLSYILNGVGFLDVRAPVEFEDGHIPGALNIPLLENQERHEVGSLYKAKGKEAAVSLGHQIVTGDLRQHRLEKWLQFFKKNPDGLLYCFRGGLRSQTVQGWLKEAGQTVPLIEGGYKAVRQYFLNYLDEISQGMPVLLISGPTGSGKTHLVKEAENFFPSLDLEFLARHRGSAFGFESFAQPAQAQFENLIAVSLLRTLAKYQDQRPVLFEDESRLIGRCAVPEKLFQKMRQSAVVWVDEPLSQRIENIFFDYITHSAIGNGTRDQALDLFKKYEKSLQAISKKLGGLKTTEILKDLQASREAYINEKNLESNRVWIEKLLLHYYDPLYLGSLERRNPKVIFRGSGKEVLAYLRQL